MTANLASSTDSGSARQKWRGSIIVASGGESIGVDYALNLILPVLVGINNAFNALVLGDLIRKPHHQSPGEELYPENGCEYDQNNGFHTSSLSIAATDADAQFIRIEPVNDST
jgi:hypothetical protein